MIIVGSFLPEPFGWSAPPSLLGLCKEPALLWNQLHSRLPTGLPFHRLFRRCDSSSCLNDSHPQKSSVHLDRRGQFYIFSIRNGLIHDIVCAVLSDNITLTGSLTLLNFHRVPFFGDIRFQRQWQIIA